MRTWRRVSRACELTECVHVALRIDSAFLFDSFTSLNVTKVNTYGLVLRWQGSNPSLKPILTTAHQGES